MEFIIYLICFLLMFIVIAISVALASNEKKKDAIIKNEERLDRNYLKRAIKTLEANGFLIEKQILLKRYIPLCVMGDAYAVIFDNSNKQIALIDTINETCCVEDYDKYREFSIYCKDKQIVSGTDGSALLGAFLFGTTGAIVGAAAEKEIKTNVDNLKLYIKFNDFEIDHICFEIVSDGCTMSGAEIQESYDGINKLSAALEYINSEKNKKDKKTNKKAQK